MPQEDQQHRRPRKAQHLPSRGLSKTDKTIPREEEHPKINKSFHIHSIMETPHLVPRHRFLVDEWVTVEIDDWMYRGVVRGVNAPEIEISDINPYGIRAANINACHSDTYTVIFYEPQPDQSNAGANENTQATAISRGANDAQATTHESNQGMLIRCATGPGQPNRADQRHPSASMPRGAVPITPPYTVILYGMFAGDVRTYFHNLPPMAHFGISPNSITAHGTSFYADVPFGTEPYNGVYHLLHRCDIIPSYLVEIQDRLECFNEYVISLSSLEYMSTDI